MNRPSRVPAPVPATEPADGIFRLIAEQWPGAVLVLDPRLRVSWVNEQARSLAGPQAVAGAHWDEIGLPWTLDAGTIERLRSGERESFEPAQLAGAWHGMRLSALREAGGAVTAILCAIEPRAALESRLATALWGAGMGLWEMDFRTGHTRWFSDWCERLDIDPCAGADHVTRWDSHIHPDDLPEAARRFGAHLAGEADYYDAEYRLRDRRGRWRWLFERGRVLSRAADGSALRMVGICMDVDARKEAELAGLREQRRLEVALESARGGMWEWNLATDEVHRTDFYYRMLGLEPEEARRTPRQSWSEHVHPEDEPKVRSAMAEVIDGRGELYEAEYRLRHADGSWVWVLDRARAPERDRDGRAVRLVGFMVDITDRVRTQEALRLSEFRYRTVASLTPGFIFECRFRENDGLEFTWVSDGVQDIIGCSAEEMERRGGWLAFADPLSRSAIRTRLVGIRSGEPQSGETIVHTVDGQVKWLHIRTMPMRDPDTGKVAGVIGSAHHITTRKRAEQALRESAAVLRAVTENTPDWLFLIDEQLHVRFLNRAFAQWDTESVVGLRFTDVLLERYRAGFEELCRGVLGSGAPARCDLQHPGPDDSSASLEARIMPVLDGGIVRSLTVAVTDVTERKGAERALRESKSVLQTVADSSADWLALFDRDRRCVFMNRTFRGRAADEWVGRAVEEFAPEVEAQWTREVFDRVIATGEPSDVEQSFRDEDGLQRFLEVRLRPVLTDEHVHGVAVNLTDVSDRHAQENVLRTQARILQTMREGVVLVDMRNHVRLTNPAFDAMFGYPPGELLGRSVDPLVAASPAQRARLFRQLRRGSDPELMPIEFECARRDGSRFVASCVVTPLGIRGEQHFLAVLNDITERKRLEREIIEIANREQQRIGGDLHDGLGQDLTGIALMLRAVAAQLRKEDSPARLDVEDVIGLVNNAIESTRALARGLSPVSAEQGGLAVALQSLADMASDRYGIRIAFHPALHEPLRLGETAATHLYRIAQEALTNVIRHSSATEVTITLGTAGGELHLRIEDNGRGFVRPLDEASGLGLKIMRYRAQMLGGEIVIEAAEHGGAAVRCACPLAGANAQSERPGNAGRAPH